MEDQRILFICVFIYILCVSAYVNKRHVGNFPQKTEESTEYYGN